MSRNVKRQKTLSYSLARRRIRRGDLLLFRRSGLIASAGRSVYSHAAMADWWDGDLFCLEFRGFRGGRAVVLSSQVERYPGRIDVFACNPDCRRPNFDRREAARFMRRLTGRDYGWINLLGVAVLHVPVLRWIFKADTKDDRPVRLPPFCSQAVAMAYRLGGGVDPVPNLADRMTEPADLARSRLFRYRFTLERD